MLVFLGIFVLLPYVRYLFSFVPSLHNEVTTRNKLWRKLLCLYIKGNSFHSLFKSLNQPNSYTLFHSLIAIIFQTNKTHLSYTHTHAPIQTKSSDTDLNGKTTRSMSFVLSLNFASE